MLRPALKLLGLTLMLIAGSAGIAYYQHYSSASKQIEQLQSEKHELEHVVQRLSTENRVADILVSHQEVAPSGKVLNTTLLFVEYDKQGDPLPAKSFTFEGDHAHIDALVLKFDRDFVTKDDPLRGHSIALFTRIYGEYQKPTDGAMIDTPGKIPDIYRAADPHVSEFEMDLWQNFWKLYDDEDYRKKKGVRVEGGASGQSVWGPFKPDRLYTITIESAGGISMTSSPLKGVYREALKERVVTTEPAASTQPTIN